MSEESERAFYDTERIAERVEARMAYKSREEQQKLLDAAAHKARSGLWKIQLALAVGMVALGVGLSRVMSTSPNPPANDPRPPVVDPALPGPEASAALLHRVEELERQLAEREGALRELERRLERVEALEHKLKDRAWSRDEKR